MTVPPELLYLLAGDPVEFAQIVAGMRPADVAEALRDLPPAAAARVIAALPFDLAVQVLDEPQLEHRVAMVQAMDISTAGPLIDAMSPDQRTDLFPRAPREGAAPALARTGAADPAGT